MQGRIILVQSIVLCRVSSWCKRVRRLVGNAGPCIDGNSSIRGTKRLALQVLLGIQELDTSTMGIYQQGQYLLFEFLLYVFGYLHASSFKRAAPQVPLAAHAAVNSVDSSTMLCPTAHWTLPLKNKARYSFLSRGGTYCCSRVTFLIIESSRLFTTGYLAFLGDLISSFQTYLVSKF
jgi:hypothetical protein